MLKHEGLQQGHSLTRKVEDLSCEMRKAQSKGAMVEGGVLGYAIKSLGSSLVKEVESAAALIFKLSRQQKFCEKIGSEKGAIIHLVRLVSNTQDNLMVSNIAEQILSNLEQVDSNVLQMAEVGRFQTVLMRLCEGILFMPSFSFLQLQQLTSYNS
ncbi:hypothetical protein O6H91_17G066600 [Diphasiastrum complanatum]|uniref:Uncharacterized protein n=1 Tax=Diphasiastrum complanatum TaxID=34168 RepID=A0ACC2B7V4_DIPCM|nr:hypothetical protein O6H91_17G066600 [Diphasiastrum complanatum]